ncbi:MAG: hypothetical protein K0S79_2542 [Nitrospira sp.]|nr:hypothetical protein [Nitrospira sp.]
MKPTKDLHSLALEGTSDSAVRSLTGTIIESNSEKHRFRNELTCRGV